MAPAEGGDRGPGPGGRARIARAVDALGHLAAWPTLYVACLVPAIALLAGAPADARRVAFAALAGWPVFVIDRVKLRARDADPADAESRPERVRFVRARERPMRAAALAACAAAIALGWSIHPALALAPPALLVGVVVYARPRSRGFRPKDTPLLKNVLVAGGLVSLAGAALAAPGGAGWGLPWLACGVVFLGVLGDAVLSDLDDEPSDRRHGTRTLAVLFGGRAAFAIGFALVGVSALAGVLGARAGALAPGPSIAWAVAGPLACLGVLAAPAGRRTDAVDVRLPLAVFAAWLASVPWG